MNNMECAVAVLAAHRAGGQWTDEAVARDMLAQLDVDPVGNAAKARPVVMPGITEDEVRAQEAAAEEAVAKARAAREALDAQRADESQGDEAVRLLTAQREEAEAAREREMQAAHEPEHNTQRAQAEANAKNPAIPAA